MALPFLYSSDDSTNDYTKNGLGALPDCTFLLTSSSLNGEITLQGSVPVGKSNVENIINGNIIKLKINDTQKPQILRLYNVKKSMASGSVTFSAEPISNDLRTYFLPKVEIDSMPVVQTFEELRDKSIPPVPSRFNFYSDKENSASIKLERVNVLQSLGGVEGSILQRFKGEYEKDNHDIYLHKRMGEDHKIKILYTKNLTGLDIEVDTQGVVNGIYPFAKLDDSEDVIEITEKILFFEKQYPGGVINPVDFSEGKPTNSSELQTLAETYLQANTESNTPKVSAKIDFILLNKQPNYREFVNMESVGLGDGVDVYHPDLDVDLHARVVGYEYDSLTEQYTKLEVGSVKSNFINQIVDKIDDNNQDFDDKLGLLEDAQQEASDIIKNPGEGHVVIYPSLADPQEILIMDTTDVNTAQHIWRFNQGGLAFSRTGYNGTYELAMTNNGAIVADRITTGVLKAINIVGVNISGATIEGGTVSSKGTDFTLKQDNGVIRWLRNSDQVEFFRQLVRNFNNAGEIVSNIRFELIRDNQGFTITHGDQLLSDSYLSYTKTTFGAVNKGNGASFIISSKQDDKNSVLISGLANSDLLISQTNNSKSCYVMMNDGLVTVGGNFKVTGTKSSAIQTDHFGERLLYAFETPEYLFSTYGKATTNEDGYVEVEIEPMFLETINTDSKNYHVFVSPYDNTTAYACFLEQDRFLIKSDKPNIEVSWQLVAYRKDYEEFYLETPESNSEKSPEVIVENPREEENHE